LRAIVGGADKVAPPLNPLGWRITFTSSVKNPNMPTDFVTPFFANESNLSILKSFSSKLSGDSSPNDPDLVRPLQLLLHYMVEVPNALDKWCTFNIKHVGVKFISLAQNYEAKRDDKAQQQQQQIFALAYRFFCELEFSTNENRSLDIDLREVQIFVDANIDSFPADLKKQLIYAGYLMPVHIARELLQHPDLASMRDFNTQQVSAPKLKQKWDDELQQKEEQVTALSEQLEKLRTGFNFVGLVDGFRQLAKQKIAEKRIAFWALIALGVLVVAPVIAEVIFLISLHIDSFEKYKQSLIFILPPVVALEVLFIYFFRVVLVHFRSIKAQLLQLELRTALCQFIESYSSYSEKIKKQNPTALDKFESLVFSGLLASEEQLPSTFDGTEQLAKLFKSMKSSA
jgi:hypothetical protein